MDEHGTSDAGTNVMYGVLELVPGWFDRLSVHTQKEVAWPLQCSEMSLCSRRRGFCCSVN